jgi:hypothetical protein
MTATPFLWNGGTNGFLATQVLMTTELNALADSTSAVSSVNGTSGLFTQTNFGQGMLGIASFTFGGAFTPAAGGYCNCYFLGSLDGGSTLEAAIANNDIPRTPDFTFTPIGANAYSSGQKIFANTNKILIPAWATKLLVMSHFLATLPATGNIITIGAYAPAH